MVQELTVIGMELSARIGDKTVFCPNSFEGQ